MNKKKITTTQNGANKIDQKAYTATLQSGLYLVSNCLFNPTTQEKYYLVKVGRATHMKDRMKQYDTTNPLMYHIDYHYMPRSSTQQIQMMEKACHHFLHSVAIKNDEVRAREWVCVDEKTYWDICNQGFKWFRLD